MKKIIFPALILLFIALQQWAFAGDRLRGELLYQKRCANCHGPAGEGNGPDTIKLNFNPKPVNFVNDAKNSPPGRLSRKTNKQLAQSIRNGVPNTAMGSFKTLSDEEIEDLVLYVRSLHRK